MKLKFRKKSKNIVKNPIIIQYNPPEWLDSAEVWLLLHSKCEPLSLISLIYKRLASWLISINKDWKDHNNTKYILHKIKDLPELAPSYETIFRESFFNHWKDIKINFEENLYLDDSLTSLEEHWYQKWWFIKNDWIDNSTYIVMWFIIFLMILLFIIPHNEWKGQILTIIIFIVYIIILIFPKLWIIVGIEIPKFKSLKKTEKGNNLTNLILWFKKFLETCDTNVLRTFLKKDPLYFDKVLPYATIFWIESELIEKFHPLIDEFGINLHIYQINNHLYSILHNTGENSTPKKKLTVPTVKEEWDNSYTSDIWFKNWSSFSKWWKSFSKWWGWGGGWWKNR